MVSVVLQTPCRNRGFCSSGLCVPADRMVLGHRAPADRLPHGPACAGTIRADARSARHADLIQHQATREFRRRYELRDLSDVFRFLCSLSPVAGAGRKSDAVLCVPVQSIHPCGRIDTVRAVRANELDFPGSSQQLHSNFHDRRRVRLRSVARLQPPRARGRRDMRLLAALCVLFAVAGLVDRSFAADPRYPDWPCAQAKVPEISLAAVWNGPALDDAASKWKDNAKVSALVVK